MQTLGSKARSSNYMYMYLYLCYTIVSIVKIDDVKIKQTNVGMATAYGFVFEILIFLGIQICRCLLVTFSKKITEDTIDFDIYKIVTLMNFEGQSQKYVNPEIFVAIVC